jgi:hypothetical protein
MTPSELLALLCITSALLVEGRGVAVLEMDELRVNDMDDDPDTLVSHWQAPDILGLDGIKLLVASAELSGFTLPSESEAHESSDADEPTFDPPVPLGIGTTWAAMLATPGVVTLHGPELFGSLVSGFGMLASNGALDCSTAQCSSIVIADAAPNLLITEFELVADGPVVAGNSLGSMTLDRPRIELRAGALAMASSTGDHVVGAGNASFAVIGEVDGHVRRTAGTNSTRIVLERDGEGWQTSSFDISITDQQGQRWIVNIPAGHWR